MATLCANEISAQSRGLSFEDAYLEHHDFVWRSLRGLGVPAAMVDDATQDVFMVVHRRLPSFDRAAPLRAWIFGIARNFARKYRKRATPERPNFAVVDNAQPLPDELLQLRETADVVERALDGLGEGQRSVFVLAQIEGMTAPEIAEVLGIKLNTAYSRLRIARARIERAMHRFEARQARNHGR